jgi:hypothetical protein
VLDTIGRCHGRRAERICRYLTSVATADGALPALHPSQRGYRTAPYLPDPHDIPDDPPSNLLATGPVTGLLHRNNVWDAWLFRATDYCWTAIDRLRQTHPYEVLAALAFLDGAPDRPRAEAAAERLGALVREQRLAVTDPARADAFPLPAGYPPGERHFAPDFAPTPDALARRWFTDAELERGLDHLAAEQREDGGWPIRWRAWAPGSAVESRPLVTIEALRTLRAYGRNVRGGVG